MTTLKIDRQKVKDAFAAYVVNYNADDPKVRLKIEHTYRVAALCERIGRSEGLDGADADLAWLVGMLHDVGRFEQIKNYGTFNDAESVDHAAYGCKFLFEENLIRDYVEPGEDELIFTAIKNHNVYRIPENLTEREYLYVNLLRDADKIDILKVNCDFRPEDIYNVTTQALLSEEITPEVLDAVREKHTVLKSIRKTAVDNLAGHISLVFELIYPESLRITMSQGYLEKLLDFHSNNSHTMEQFEVIKETVADFFREKLD